MTPKSYKNVGVLSMKRQIVWLMADTTRYDMLGCYGFADMRTPNLDALAREGIRFDRAYSAQPVCGPARSALFTGLFPHENGSWGNSMPLGQDVMTLGQRLSSHGIPCAFIGKWHLDGGDYFGYGICPPGWDPEYWYDMKCYLDELGSDEERLRSRMNKTRYDGMDERFTYGYRCTERAVRYLEQHGDGDFFLTVSFDEPHGPALCPQPYASMYEGESLPDTPAMHDSLENKPLYQRLWAQTTNPDREAVRRAQALSCNAFIDDLIGRIIGKVHEVAPDALILFTSDHGAALGAHGLNTKGAAIYDEIARIPLIFAGGGCQKGQVVDGVVSHVDLPATVLDYMGVPIPRAFTGKSLMGVLSGREEAPGRAFVEFNRYERDHDGFGGLQLMRALITNEYKLALHLTDTDEFYVTAQDPYDLENRIDAPDCRAVRDRMHDRLLDWMNATRDPFRGYQWQCRPWRTDRRPRWAVDGFTRQPENEPGEYRQLDYNTGLTMEQAVRAKE